MKMKMKMKKLITGIVMAAFLTVAVAGQAMAYFENNHLSMFFYKDGGSEVGYDLGDTASMDFTPLSNQVLAPAGTFDFLAETGADTLADVNVGMFASKMYNDIWIVSNQVDIEPIINTSYAMNYWDGVNAIRGLYGSGNPIPTQKVSAGYGVPGSYGQAMNVNTNAPGAYAEFNGYTYLYGELNMADAGDLSDLYLYHYAATGPGAFVLDTGVSTPYKAVLDIGLDGSVTMNPVPIPGAVWLFGSGLLGLVGIRRRKLA